MDLLNELATWKTDFDKAQAEEAAKEKEEAERKEAARKQEQAAKRRAEIEAKRRSDESRPRSRPSSSKTVRRHSTSPPRDRSPKSIARAKPKDPNGGKSWTIEDDQMIRELYESKLYSNGGIAKMLAERLGRSVSAVQTHINRMFNSNYQHTDEDNGVPGVIPPKGDYNYADMAVVALYHLPRHTGYLTTISRLVNRFFANDLDMRRLDGCANVPRYRSAMSPALTTATNEDWAKKDERFERLNQKKGNEYYYKLTEHGIKLMETTPRFRQFLTLGEEEEEEEEEENKMMVDE